MQNIWTCLDENLNSQDGKQNYNSGNLCDLVMKLSMTKSTQDNISCIFISFRHFMSKISFYVRKKIKC